MLAKYLWKKTSDGSTSDSVRDANSAVPGMNEPSVASSAPRMIADPPPLDFFFGFFCSHLSRKTVSVMSAKGSPSYSIGLPSSRVLDMADTDGCDDAASTVSSHQQHVSARAYKGSRFSMSYRSPAFATFGSSSSASSSEDLSLSLLDVGAATFFASASPSNKPVRSSSLPSLLASVKCSTPSTSASRG